MRLRSLLLFISSSFISFIEAISEVKTVKITPAEIITRIVTSFINGSVEQPQSFSHETFLDILIEKIPNSDEKGMHYHEVYLAISPMVNNVNWTRIKFDRRDAMMCYNSLTNILQVCFERIGLANHAEADQLVLAIYVTSVWCSILKQRPELSHPIPDQCDFESYMKTWIFHPHFENFSKVFVASCCQIMESSEHMKTTCSKVETQTPETDHHETPKPSSLPASLPEVQDTIPAEPAPSLQIHPSWRASPHFNPYMGCMNTVPFVPLNTHGFSSHSEHHQNYPPMFHYSPVTPIPTAPSAELPSTTRAPKRKQSKQQKLPSIHELTGTLCKPSNKKGPRPGTKYRQRITEQESIILQIEAEKIAMKPQERYSKRKISERTNISLYQVKSFFNRITAEQRRQRLNNPEKRSKNRRKLQSV